jgi:hypothetical protein
LTSICAKVCSSASGLKARNTNMSRFVFELATPADDEQLRDLLAATPMEGNISVAFARQPSYFAAAEVDGTTLQVGVARDRDSGRIIGMGSRAIGLRYVNGERVSVGYLSGLRLMQDFRGRAGLLARGYRFLHRLHGDRSVSYYLTTIAEDNNAAMSLLTSGRAGLPVYHPWGNFHTLAISARAASKGEVQHNAVHIRLATALDRDAIVQFLNEQGSSRQFFPVYGTHDLFSGRGLLRGLNCDDLLLAWRNGEIVGTLGCWNQRGFKQIVVHSYHGWLRPMRPVVNTWATIRRRPTLPGAGSILRVHVAAIPVVRGDDVDVFRLMFVAMLRRMAKHGEPLLLIGFHEADPLLPIARQYAGRVYGTKLYIVYWPDEVPDLDALRQRAPYLELGGL